VGEKIVQIVGALPTVDTRVAEELPVRFCRPTGSKILEPIIHIGGKVSIGFKMNVVRHVR